MITEEIRSYEVSIWTLQDDFITVLKWSDVEHKGRIQNPNLAMANDGTPQIFTFSIPMYYDNGTGCLIENPIWYNTRNGNIMINLRKIKIIFNKKTADEEVFEFLITKINEVHEQDILTCEITCEDLAFHELGKIGYNYYLSLEEYEVDREAAIKEGYNLKQNVQYWCEKVDLKPYPTEENPVINPKYWYYLIDMDWSSFENGLNRSSSIVYEEMYTSEWTFDELHNEIYPKAIETAKEKERTVDVQESNIYNITQEIAKQFGIYCKYVYEHDENYHISGRKIIFFNNFLHDKKIINFTYPYSSKHVSREIDSTDTITKLYVRSMSDDSTRLGEANISYCKANRMRENYVLNFDYLKETDAITAEQADAIAEYEKAIFKLNEQLLPLYDIVAAYENEKVDLDAKKTTYTNSIDLELEQITSNNALKLELVEKYSAEAPSTDPARYVAGRTASNPDGLIITQDKQSVYYINLNSAKKGIQEDSVHVYRSYNTVSHTLSREVARTSYYFKYDDYGNPTAIYGIAPEMVQGNSSSTTNSRVYLTYNYEPELYYESIVKTWEEKLDHDQKALDEVNSKLDNDDPNNLGLNQLLAQQKENIERLEAQKKETIKQFDIMMGPALREGYWQPENYQDYSEKHYGTKVFKNDDDTDIAPINTEEDFVIGWDPVLFDTEQNLYYESSVNLNRIYYPCINISECFDEVKALINNERGLPVSVIFNNNCYCSPYASLDEWKQFAHHEGQEYYIYDENHILHHYIYHESKNDQPEVLQEVLFSESLSNIRSFTIGSEAQIAWVRTAANVVYPAIILTGTKNMSERELNFMYNDGNLSIGIITTNIVNKNVELDIDAQITIGKTTHFWVFDTIDQRVWTDDTHTTISGFNCDGIEVVYPRIKFSSLMLKTNTGLYVTYNTKLLDNYTHYYINTRTIPERDYSPEYLVTIKPDIMLKYGEYTFNPSSGIFDITIGTVNVNYLLSNASTAIYLDALKIAKENAYPKVSYTLEPNILDKSLMRTLYNKLNYLVVLNDVQLKFRNVYGYISHISLNLDQPQNDTVELKNYTSKFEDLFSQIVAQSEEMQRNENLLGPISRGVYSLSPTGFLQTLESNGDTLINFLEEKFLPSSAMTNYMANIFLEASNILSDANCQESHNLSSENSAILSGFSTSIQDGMVPTIYKQEYTPTTFKQGDIWIQITVDDEGNEIEVARYSATCNSINSKPGYGWVKTYGGSYASLEGESMTIDATTGNFSFSSENGATSIDGDGVILASNNNTINIIKQSGISLLTNTALGSQLTKNLLKISLESDNTVQSLSFDVNGLLLRNSDFKVDRSGENVTTDYIHCTSDGVDIKGTFTGVVNATSFSTESGGSISWSSYIKNLAGWKVSGTHFGNTVSLTGTNGSTLGMMNDATSGAVAFWAGGLYDATGTEAPGFKVTNNGEVYIKKLKVYHNNKWQTIDLTTNFTDAVSYMGGTWNGTTKKLSATIGLYSTLTKVLEIDGSNIWQDGYNQAANAVTANDVYNVLPGDHLTFSVPTTGGGTKTIHIYGPTE